MPENFILSVPKLTCSNSSGRERLLSPGSLFPPGTPPSGTLSPVPVFGRLSPVRSVLALPLTWRDQLSAYANMLKISPILRPRPPRCLTPYPHQLTFSPLFTPALPNTPSQLVKPSGWSKENLPSSTPISPASSRCPSPSSRWSDKTITTSTFISRPATPRPKLKHKTKHPSILLPPTLRMSSLSSPITPTQICLGTCRKLPPSPLWRKTASPCLPKEASRALVARVYTERDKNGKGRKGERPKPLNLLVGHKKSPKQTKVKFQSPTIA
ncbi:hypothetical protein L204_101788 [Cryptococcus depauperatus]|nr:hypothetical protein L204_04242 [Cryptococcus depauperatus CBS 7855]